MKTAIACLAVIAATHVAGCSKSTPAKEPASQPDMSSSSTPAETSVAAKVFEDRIAPIFKSPDPSSCARCHLAAVDLKDYILPSAKDTFLALRDQGLINLDRPEESKILKLINRGAGDPQAAGLISAKKQKAEYDAFAAWIKACAADAVLRNAPGPEKGIVLAVKPVEVVRHARKDRMIESFESNVWSMRFRCMNCHTEGSPQNDKLVKEHGPRVAWFKKGGPEATMDYLLSSKLIDFEKPERSLLLLKPLNEVKHGGGVKFVVGDQGYRAFRAWVEDAVAIKTGKYTRAADLPRPENGPAQFGTDAWLKLDRTPDSWGDRLLRVDVYAWDAKAEAWEKEPIATSDRVVWGKGKLWQHTLTLLAPRGSERGERWRKDRPSLPPGRYLAKVYIDTRDRMKNDWKATLGVDDYVGQTEFQARWGEGYGAMTVVDASRVKK